MSKSWQGGSTRAWRRTRAAVLLRDGYRCQLRLDGCTTRATCVHHTVGKGVSEDPADLVASCVTCNNTIGKPEGDPLPRPTTRW